MTPETKSTLNGIGRYLPAVLAAVAIGLVGWLAQEVVGMKAAISGLEMKVELTTNNRYRGEDADRDFEARDRLLRNHEERIRDLERARLK